MDIHIYCFHTAENDQHSKSYITSNIYNADISHKPPIIMAVTHDHGSGQESGRVTEIMVFTVIMKL